MVLSLHFTSLARNFYSGFLTMLTFFYDGDWLGLLHGDEDGCKAPCKTPVSA